MDLTIVLNICATVTVLLLVDNIASEDSSNFTVLSQHSRCAFPSFLQTNCTSSSRVCEWNFGKRIALPLEEQSSPTSKFRAVRGTTQWSWQVLNGTIVVKYLQQEHLNSRTKTIIVEKYDCVEKYVGSQNTFLISKTDLKEDKPQITKLFNCIRFFVRSKTVVEYKLGPWVNSVYNLSCLDNSIVFPLISDRYYGVIDCPSELRGGFEILNIYDGSRQRHCQYLNGTYGILESDCITKEGLTIDFGNTHNCTNPSLGNSFPHELRLRCHSKTWKEGNMTYVMTSQRARWTYEYEKTTFQCLMFDSRIDKGEFNLYISNQGNCGRFFNVNKYTEGIKLDGFVVRIRRRKASSVQKFVLEDRCMFPAEIQGDWLQESNHTKTNTVTIKKGSITFSSGDCFNCYERFIFKYKHLGCGLSQGKDRWPLHGRINFHHDDYTLVSRFQNGCRPRITRLGISSTVDNHVVVYRLSHSEPIVNDGRSAQQYYDHEILKRLCGMTYPYEPDPYPYWGRNIEKILHRQRLPAQPIKQCSLIFNSRHHLMSTIAVTESTSCPAIETKVSFGCKQPYSTSKFLNIVYDKNCHKKNVKFQCIGKAWKFGHFILLRDTVTQRLSCVWFDKKSNSLFRLNSPQCSDVDWGQLPGHSDKFPERFQIKYFEKCPYAPDPTVRAKVSNSVSSVCHTLWITVVIPSISVILLIQFKI